MKGFGFWVSGLGRWGAVSHVDPRHTINPEQRGFRFRVDGHQNLQVEALGPYFPSFQPQSLGTLKVVMLDP